MKDTYLTLAGPAIGEFKDRGSKFIACAFPILNEDWQPHLEAVKKEHPKARHHCYAFRIGLDGNNFRANDDGEPSGTAGRPILGQIDHFNLTNVIVIVVRYFGGTLLGTSGLINAYKSSAQAALSMAEIKTVVVGDRFRIDFDYSVMGELMNVVKKLGITVQSQHFGDKPHIDFIIRKSEAEPTLLQLKASMLKVSASEASTVETIPGMRIIKLPE